MAQKIGKYEENRPVILISVAFIYYCPAKNFVCVTIGILEADVAMEGTAVDWKALSVARGAVLGNMIIKQLSGR